jgi:hypothetical protein
LSGEVQAFISAGIAALLIEKNITAFIYSGLKGCCPLSKNYEDGGMENCRARK